MSERAPLRALIVVTDADGALASKAMGPIATELHVCLRQLGMAEQEPEAEDWLGKKVQDGIRNNLVIDSGLAGAVCDTPDAV